MALHTCEASVRINRQKALAECIEILILNHVAEFAHGVLAEILKRQLPIKLTIPSDDSADL